MTRTDTGARPGAEGAALLAGAALTVVLVDLGPVGYHWLPLLLGGTYLAAAAAGGSRGRLWAPGLVLAGVGATIGLWFEAGRGGDDYRLLPLVVLGLGLGAVLAALLAERGFAIAPMGVALPVVLFGGFALLDQAAPGPLGGRTWPYAALVAAWGLVVVVRARRP
ncbi:MAG TPA: hypothetical protein VM433_10115 [Mycobacteriales bacterium]|nr:hypothetical protein [Mycobacteriales bacterium]